MPRPGTDGRFSGGGDNNCETPDASIGVTRSGATGRLAIAAAGMPGIGGAGDGTALAIDEPPPCTVRRTPGGVIRSANVTGENWVGGDGGLTVPAVAATEDAGAGVAGGVTLCTELATGTAGAGGAGEASWPAVTPIG